MEICKYNPAKVCWHPETLVQHLFHQFEKQRLGNYSPWWESLFLSVLRVKTYRRYGEKSMFQAGRETDTERAC